MLNQTGQEKKVEVALWAIKEAAWELHKKAFWEPGVAQTVEHITSLVNKQLRQLGYNPVILGR